MPGTLRILIVDDSTEDREQYKRLLAQDPEQEYELLETDLGEEGLRLAAVERPDCLLLDYRLPDMDGVEFLSRLVNRDPIAVIVLTGQGSESVAVQAMKGGAQDYLLKGAISPQELRRAVKYAVEKVANDALKQEILVRQAAEEERAKLLVREQDARRQAEEANRIKDEFLATLSHELRTPLNAILGWAQVLRSGKVDEPTTARALEAIERNSRAQAQLISDLLDVSRIITGKLRLEQKPLDLPRIIEAALESVRPAADAKSIRLRVTVDRAIGPLVGDPDRLQQVVWNLLSNAIKFTPQGGSVEVQLRRPGDLTAGMAEISVSDTGAGIRPDFLPYVFDRFRQAESSTTRKHGGLGLGLSIVRHLVELHGGTVLVESPGEGLGSIFMVRLPIRLGVEAEAATERRRVPSHEPEMCPELLAGLHVLLVDDEADTLEMLATAIQHCGARVTAVASVPEALAAIDRELPNVLISDIGVPGEDGYSLIRKIRLRPAELGGKLPAAALTAYARTEDRIRALAAGFQTHLAKPVDPAELVATIAVLAGRLEAVERSGR
ncbi:MAG TPA: response regulator [Thermoanaerobaculia bacterium]|nr:response regulator [Thermoanaerobaculia bacterium]